MNFIRHGLLRRRCLGRERLGASGHHSGRTAQVPSTSLPSTQHPMRLYLLALDDIRKTQNWTKLTPFVCWLGPRGKTTLDLQDTPSLKQENRTLTVKNVTRVRRIP
uniref:Uncharacterized protein n=1 Tax=Timema monikensis TaxID=170555 RepID=A0A7R9HPH7_9NEOP|nr:unnamed protein product [Timema monikensis]